MKKALRIGVVFWHVASLGVLLFLDVQVGACSLIVGFALWATVEIGRLVLFLLSDFDGDGRGPRVL